MNRLFYGDNLDVLREHIQADSVDLIYLDPPFNSDQHYNKLFKEHDGVPALAQMKAFEDTWTWSDVASASFDDAVGAGGRVADVLIAFRAYMPASDMLAYLSMMAPRLIELRRVLKSTGTVYLHCDPTAGHYLKVLMDAIFGPENFRSEIVWKRTNTHSDAKRWSPVHDTLLMYTKTSKFTWNPQHAPHSEDYVASKYRHEDQRGRYQLDNMTSPKPRPNMMYEWKGFASPPNGWRYSKATMARLETEGRIWYPDSTSKRPRLKRYLHEMSGVMLADVWTDISPLNSQAQERIGYPTQKPVALLDRIIKASSSPGDIVLDPFCGCGTTVEACSRAPQREWIGIDITYLAIRTIKRRLKAAFGDTVQYQEDGEPTSVQEAEALATLDPLDFQAWVMSKLRGTRVKAKPGADRGIDDRIYFRERGNEASKQIIVSVKGGHTGASHLRDLRGVVDRERAAIGVLVTLQEPSKAMRREATDGGHYESPWGRYPRLQLLTVSELLGGKGIHYPEPQGSNALRERRKENKRAEQPELPLLTKHEGGGKVEKPARAKKRRRA